nr:DHHA1 domain-containing protein [Malacoplasma iowae]
MNFKNDVFEKNKNTNLNELHYFELKNMFDLLSNELNIVKFKINKEKENTEILELKDKFNSYNDKINLLIFENIDRKVLTSTCTNIVNEKKENIFIVVNFIDNSFQYILCANPKFIESLGFNLNQLNKEIVDLFNAKGGGRNNFVQGSFPKVDNKDFNKILEKAKTLYKW